MVNEDEDDYKKIISKYRKSVLEETVLLHLLFKTFQKYDKRKETAKDVSELNELKKRQEKIFMIIQQTEKELSNLTHKWSFFILQHGLFDKSKQTKRILSFLDDNDRIRKICEIIFTLFDEFPDLLNVIKVKEFIVYIGEYFEKPEEFVNPKEYLKTLCNNLKGSE